MVGKVQYIDEHQTAQAGDQELAPFFCKRKNFEYEREVRLVCKAGDAPEISGRYVSVNLEKLIEEAVIAPTAGRWLLDLVRSVTEKYGLKVPVVASKMLEPPDDPSCRGVDPAPEASRE